MGINHEVFVANTLNVPYIGLVVGYMDWDFCWHGWLWIRTPTSSPRWRLLLLSPFSTLFTHSETTYMTIQHWIVIIETTMSGDYNQSTPSTYPPRSFQDRNSIGVNAINARALYPQFLSLPETLIHQLSWAWRGLVDSFRWDIVVAITLGWVHDSLYLLFPKRKRSPPVTPKSAQIISSPFSWMDYRCSPYTFSTWFSSHSFEISRSGSIAMSAGSTKSCGCSQWLGSLCTWTRVLDPFSSWDLLNISYRAHGVRQWLSVPLRWNMGRVRRLRHPPIQVYSRLWPLQHIAQSW